MKASRNSERGAALVLALVVLLVLILGGLAVMRSMNTALTTSGNLAFRRDLVNQAEQAVAKAVASTFPKGSAAIGNAILNVNYSPVTLATNDQGIPLALVDDSVFATVGVASNDLTGATSDVKIRYVIERLCNVPTALASATNCIVFERPPTGGSAHLSNNAEPEVQPVFRVSARVLGPRNTKVFIQNTFTKPEV
ncbi:hypothetical protein G7047_00665 [Diaphorobacter sp. HDW4A]|uniref:hypothetical protein n=1 Tax=Diaphorobacter sp. HDW4A TaxID=2714924 RepID=UPI00140B368E|nr:hypothetical protein [Diaphorobacter sp. HDW4A]QIL78595.1 hypothetical protein G7047_00665 [Diaphorobacter sp. HDW4A]